MIATDIHTQRIPEIYADFASVIGANHWRERVIRCDRAIRGNEFLEAYLHRENAIAYQLDHLRKLDQEHGSIPVQLAQDRAIYPAVGFAAQVLSILEGSSKPDAHKFRRRVQGAFNNPNDMRGLRLEMMAATHFTRRGRKVTWPETTGIGTFDLLVEGIGPHGLEIECKSVSDDKGRKIHQQEVLEIWALLRPHLKATIAGLSVGLSVVLTLPGRLPSTYKERQELARQVASAIFAAQSGNLESGANIRISEFDVRQLGNVPGMRHPQELRKAIEGVTEARNRHTMLIGTRAGGALALAVQCAQDDDLMKAVFDTLSDAARRQLSGARAGILFVGFEGVDGAGLLSLAQQDMDLTQGHTALRVAVSRFLSSVDRDHVVGIGFVSAAGVQPVEDGLVDTGGTAYYFPKRESPFWSDDFSGMFTLS